MTTQDRPPQQEPQRPEGPQQSATVAEFGGGRATIPPAAPPTTDPAPPLVSAFLRLEPDGGVTVFTGKAEVGQNVRTSLAQVVAEELRLPFERVAVVLGDTDQTPFDRGTFGSRSMPDMAPRLRQAAATARERLKELAADAWEADTSALLVRDGSVVHEETGQALSFAELGAGAPLDVPVDDAQPVTPSTEWTVAGASAPKTNARSMVTGAHEYASDVSRPGMLFGRVLRPPSYGATLVGADSADVSGVPGAQFMRDGDFAGVVAPTAWAAGQALGRVRVQWSQPPASGPSSGPELYAHLRRETSEGEAGRQLADRARTETGSVDEGLARAQRVLRATYTVPYIAHAPLEPRAAVAEWSGDSLTVWTGTQRPFGVRAELMAAFDLPEERVRVIVPDTGSGYGGKHTGEAVDARGGVHLGLLASGGGDGSHRGPWRGRHPVGVGASLLQRRRQCAAHSLHRGEPAR
jgi:nicotinate dehydrogenase subunit B